MTEPPFAQLMTQTAFDTLLRTTNDYIFIKDVSLVYVACSDMFARSVGLTDAKQVVGKTDYDLFDDGTLAARYVEDDRAVLRSTEPMVSKIEPIPPRGSVKRFSSTSKYPLFDGKGHVIGLMGVGRDITSQLDLTEAQERNELANQLFDGVVEVDLGTGKILRAKGGKWYALIRPYENGDYDDMLERVASRAVCESDAALLRERFGLERLRGDYTGGRTECAQRLCVRMQGDVPCHVEVRCRLYLSKVSRSLRMLAFVRDVNQEVTDQNTLLRDATTDALTGLLNRRAFMDTVRDYITGIGSKSMHALLFIDLDSFKNVNDTLGHMYGDDVLKRAADLFRALFRDSDIIGRVGGDEFAAFIKDIRTPEDIKKRAGAIVEAFKVECGGMSDRSCITCSIGASVYAGDGKTFEQLYVEADKAMYRAKHAGKNKLAFFGE